MDKQSASAISLVKVAYCGGETSCSHVGLGDQPKTLRKFSIVWGYVHFSTLSSDLLQELGTEVGVTYLHRGY